MLATKLAKKVISNHSIIAPNGKRQTKPTFIHCTVSGMPNKLNKFKVIESTAYGRTTQPTNKIHKILSGKCLSKYTLAFLLVGLKQSQPILKQPTARG